MAHDHHAHDHGHHHVESYNKAFIIGLILNLVFVVVEFWFGLATQSLALIADAGHNLSDVAGLLLSWVGLIVTRKASSQLHSYGWKKASIMAAFINSVLLLVAMGSLAWEALSRFKETEIPDSKTVILVACLGIFINTLTALLFLSGRKKDINLQGAFLHMMADALISLGVVVAGVITYYTKLSWIDPVTSLIIVIVIVVGSFRLFKRSVHMLFDGVPESISFEEVKNLLQAQPGVSQVRDLHIWNMSSTEVALTAHLIRPENVTDDQFLKALQHKLSHQFGIQHVTIQVSQQDLSRHCN